MGNTPANVSLGADIFWSRLEPCDHCVQFYESDLAFMDALEGFVLGGIRQGDAVIIIGTPAHRLALEERLQASGFDMAAAVAADQFIAVDAADTLQRFMVDDWPDEELFHQVVAGLLGRARKGHAKVRAFGEMVALMWADGKCDATMRLEQLWGRVCKNETLSLFCAYPKTGFEENIGEAVGHICTAHSKVYVL